MSDSVIRLPASVQGLSSVRSSASLRQYSRANVSRVVWTTHVSAAEICPEARRSRSSIEIFRISTASPVWPLKIVELHSRASRYKLPVQSCRDQNRARRPVLSPRGYFRRAAKAAISYDTLTTHMSGARRHTKSTRCGPSGRSQGRDLVGYPTERHDQINVVRH